MYKGMDSPNEQYPIFYKWNNIDISFFTTPSRIFSINNNFGDYQILKDNILGYPNL